MLFINFKEPKRLERYGKTRQQRRNYYMNDIPVEVGQRWLAHCRLRLRKLKKDFSQTEIGAKLIAGYDEAMKNIVRIAGKEHEVRLSELKMLEPKKKKRVIIEFGRRLAAQEGFLEFVRKQKKTYPRLLLSLEKDIAETENVIQELSHP